MKIVIIEDEKATARDLERTILTVSPESEIVTVLHTVDESIKFFKSSSKVDLVFSDIQLGDGLSFEIFKNAEVRTPVIFCTAFNQYTLEAFKASGIDYLLKPFSKSAIESALQKYQTLKETFYPTKGRFSQALNSITSRVRTTSNIPSVLIYQGDKIIPLDGNEVAIFYVDNKNTVALTTTGKKYTIPQHLDELEAEFSNYFFRANRQHLINRKAVKEATQHFNRKIRINLTIFFPEHVIVGKRKVTALLNWLRQN
jgi:two-component system, LytTR family, response regulator LytT